MTLDEAIKHAEEVAEENQRVVDTGIVCGGVTIDMLYCDDTEMIEEHLANYQECAETHRQLAEWLMELKEYRKFYSCYKCYNASASFNEYPCNVCRRGLEATKNIKDHYKEVNADDE